VDYAVGLIEAQGYKSAAAYTLVKPSTIWLVTAIVFGAALIWGHGVALFGQFQGVT